MAAGVSAVLLAEGAWNICGHGRQRDRTGSPSALRSCKERFAGEKNRTCIMPALSTATRARRPMMGGRRTMGSVRTPCAEKLRPIAPVRFSSQLKFLICQLCRPAEDPGVPSGNEAYRVHRTASMHRPIYSSLFHLRRTMCPHIGFSLVLQGETAFTVGEKTCKSPRVFAITTAVRYTSRLDFAHHPEMNRGQTATQTFRTATPPLLSHHRDGSARRAQQQDYRRVRAL